MEIFIVPFNISGDPLKTIGRLTTSIRERKEVLPTKADYIAAFEKAELNKIVEDITHDA